MSWSGLFKEAATVGKREITVKKSAYDEKDAMDIETWTDTTLFKVRGLNHLCVSGFLGMTSFSPLIAQLNSLLELILVENGLTTLPEEIGSLSRLRVLDVSHNQLSLVPHTFYHLSSLQTVLLSHNQLTLDSFPPCSNEPFKGIQYIDLVGNKLSGLPDFVYKSQSLLELKASHNTIDSISPDIGSLTSLKLIEMHKNLLREIPSELSQCVKLKFLLFDENPISDPRLRKVLEQFGATKPKAVLDYLAKSAKSKGGKKKGKGGGGKGKYPHDSDGEEDRESEVGGVQQVASYKATIRIVRPTDKFITVKATNSARHTRPYLVCAVIRNVDLEDDFGDHFRKFITLQTKIHDTVCKKRRTATIATHSLHSITPPITYKCAMAHKIHFQPLDWKEKTTARKFLDHLSANRPELARKQHAEPFSVDAVASNLSKYLAMVDASQMVFLEDSSKTVISLPPLTNCEETKISEKTRNVFVEVTSSTNLADAKAAMDSLIVEMVKAKIFSRAPSTDNVQVDNTPPIPVPPISGACMTTPASQELVIEPVKVTDEADKLLVYYPSRTDLELNEKTLETIQVLRPV